MLKGSDQSVQFFIARGQTMGVDNFYILLTLFFVGALIGLTIHKK